MTSRPLSRITIVGGGSAGWMTALYLNRYYNSGATRTKITLIESEDIGTIGVGEATVHSIRFFFAAMGLDEAELMRETGATFKTGIRFRNWKKPVAGQTHEYFHPFEEQRLPAMVDLTTAWFSSDRAQSERYDQGTCLSSHLMAEGHGPKGPSSGPYQGVVPYGYHLDAVRLGRYLRRKAVEAGVEHRVGTVDRVETQGERILALHCNGQRHEADLYIDCSGFRSLLMSQLKQDNWQSFEDALPCNRAVALQLPYPKGASPRPYTQATALDNGWVWEIDLQERRGNGYVYDGNRLSPEQAEAALRAHLGVPADMGQALHLKMKIGCLKEFWVGNCLAIGLSGGFIEPLESTGLHLINLSVRLLATHLNGAEVAQPVKDSYNRLMNGIYDDLKRFIILHYCLSDRDDSPFWRQAADSAKHSPRLQQDLALWQHKVCEFMDLAGSYATVFTDENYRFVLYGMGHTPTFAPIGDPAQHQALFDQLAARVQMALQQTLPHHQALAALK
ncbi:tryptophan halogenase family protein [Ferrimonas balearica]|uniref:tryptophan halogenase family protein n=1 Tax=Ferrimonas balearica TaxID=44012 RepID=UPI001C998822|nr:tryptophan halogenase family protein [Ferrimonas balearica]MBY5992649.1 tryptophan 7-halogenase [Ferrimonas balearica]